MSGLIRMFQKKERKKREKKERELIGRIYPRFLPGLKVSGFFQHSGGKTKGKDCWGSLWHRDRVCGSDREGGIRRDKRTKERERERGS